MKLSMIPGMEFLDNFCAINNVEVTAFGSVVRRLVERSRNGGWDRIPNLFELSPFLSDIDLYHSGSRKLTKTLVSTIHQRVHFAECFRWEVFSAIDLVPYQKDEEHLHSIPANKLRLHAISTGIEDPENGIADISEKRFRLILRENSQSILRQEGKDCGMLQGLSYLRLIAEHSHELDPFSQPGFESCRHLFAEDKWDDLKVIAEESNSLLRAKVAYRINSLRAVCPSETLWSEMLEKTGLLALREATKKMKLSDNSPWRLLDETPAAPVVSSCRLSDGGFRLGHPEVIPDSDALGRWNEMYNQHGRMEQLSDYSIPEPERDLTFVSVSPVLPISEKGEALAMESLPAKTSINAEQNRRNEQAHVEYQISEIEVAKCHRFTKGGLGVLVAFSGLKSFETSLVGEPRWYTYVLILPSICTLREVALKDGRKIVKLQIRVSFGQTLEVLPGLYRKCEMAIAGYAIQIYVVGTDV